MLACHLKHHPGYDMRRQSHCKAAPGYIGRIIAAVVISVLGLFMLAPRSPALAEDSAVVLMYHRFGESDFPSTNITIAQFEAHIAELKRGPYTVLPLPEIVDALQSGDPLPDRAVAISIDDAYLSVYTAALPRLKEAGFPFTLFVSTDPVDRGFKDMLTWDQIREIAANGGTIGHHTASHPHMVAEAEALIDEELNRSSQRFLAELGKIPKLFAYPYGEASLALERRIGKAGFAAAFGQHSGAIGGGGDFYFLPRFSMNEKYGDIGRFRLVANTLSLPAADMTPLDPLIGANNPPAIGFTVSESVENLGRLTCFASHVGEARVALLGGTRAEIRVEKPFPKGRTRVNCTLPAADGRWRWLGRQFYVP